MSQSIHLRILISAFIILLLFMSLTGIVLDKAFRDNAEKSQQENLRTQVYNLLANAELDNNNKLALPDEITEPRLNIIDSNLHARVITIDNNIIWQSKSVFEKKITIPANIKDGEFYFSTTMHNEQVYTTLNFSTIWVSDAGETAYVFQVVENRNIIDKQISLFRKNLWGWLAGVSFLLMVIQTLILRWGLEPLRQVANDLIKIEKGENNKLTRQYVKELQPLTSNLNQLLESSNKQLTRYRDSLGNMAHSLKTPIAVLQGIVSSIPGKDKKTSIEQIETINNIIDYQLQRATTAGKTQLTAASSLHSIASKIIHALQKVYRDKNIEVRLLVDEKYLTQVEQGDLYELLGNIIENAFKWCQKNIIISAKDKNGRSEIIIEDDGPGIQEETLKRILKRGQRADETTPGHGLGLAMVSDILLLYDGSIKISKSTLSGAKITITI